MHFSSLGGPYWIVGAVISYTMGVIYDIFVMSYSGAITDGLIVLSNLSILCFGYNIFDRITKEGRKYAVMLGLISQRPSELSETAISQCSNFLIFKLLHPTDVEYIKQMVPNVTNEVMKKVKLLQPGTCMAFGSAFKLTSLIKLDMPNPAPTSNSCDISSTWFLDRK